MPSRPPSGPQQVPAWSLRATSVVDVLLLLVGTSILWWVLTLLGLGVLGIGPASVAAAEVMRRHRDGHAPQILRTMWTTYRREFFTSTVRLAPFVLWQLGSLTTLRLAVAGQVPLEAMIIALALFAAASLGWSTASAAAVATVPAIRRLDLLASWRAALLCPGATPGASIMLILSLLILCLLVASVPLIGILGGVGLATTAAVRLLGRRAETLIDSLSPPHPDAAIHP